MAGLGWVAAASDPQVNLWVFASEHRLWFSLQASGRNASPGIQFGDPIPRRDPPEARAGTEAAGGIPGLTCQSGGTARGAHVLPPCGRQRALPHALRSLRRPGICSFRLETPSRNLAFLMALPQATLRSAFSFSFIFFFWPPPSQFPVLHQPQVFSSPSLSFLVISCRN